MNKNLLHSNPRSKSGVCPHSDCRKLAHQIPLTLPVLFSPDGRSRIFSDISATRCASCKNLAYWKEGVLLYPLEKSFAPTPNRDMPETTLKLYNEAADICAVSPRSASALLRLAVTKLCMELDAAGDTTSDRIGDLILKGLPIQALVALDDVKMIGDKASIPGTIDMDDDQETAHILFFNINLIVEKMISNRKKEADQYDYMSKEKIIDQMTSSSTIADQK